MTLTAFDLFSGTGKNYINPEVLRGISSVNDIGSAITFGANSVLGIALNADGSVLNGLLRHALGGYGFLVDTVTGQRLVFQYNVNAKETGGADYAIQACLGRSSPRHHYKGGKDRQLQLPIVISMKEFTRDDIRRNVRFLQSLVYPDYNGDDASLAPHPVVLIQGRLYSQDLWLVTDYEIEWGESRDPITQLPSEALVTLTLLEHTLLAKSANDILHL